MATGKGMTRSLSFEDPPSNSSSSERLQYKVKGQSLTGGWVTWMERALAAAWLALSSHSLPVQFDTVAIALLIWQTFVINQDILHQEVCSLIHVNIVLEQKKVCQRSDRTFKNTLRTFVAT